jgi:hypothetical protein
VIAKYVCAPATAPALPTSEASSAELLVISSGGSASDEQLATANITTDDSTVHFKNEYMTIPFSDTQRTNKQLLGLRDQAICAKCQGSDQRSAHGARVQHLRAHVSARLMRVEQ